MAVITESELKKHISRKTFGRIYLIYGEETFLKEGYLSLLERSIVTSTPEFNLLVLDGENAGIQDIYDAVEGLPVFSERKCVVLKKPQAILASEKDFELFCSLISDLPEYCSFIIYYDDYDKSFIKTNTKFKKTVEISNSFGYVCEFKKWDSEALVKFIARKADKRGCSIKFSTAKLIIELCKGELQRIDTELEKLIAATGEGEITGERAIELIAPSPEFSVFNLFNMLMKGNYNECFRIIDSLFSQNIEPLAIVGGLSSCFIDMKYARAAQKAGVSVKEAAKELGYYGREWKLTNALRDSKHVSDKSLTEAINLLINLDFALKTGRVDPRIKIEEFIFGFKTLTEKGERFFDKD